MNKSKEIVKIQKAVDAYQKALQDNPKDMQIYFNFAKLLTRIGKHKEVIKLWNMAMSQKPDDFRLHYEIGRFYEANQNYKEALKGFENALRLNPKFFLAANAKGSVFYKLLEYEKALQAFEQCLKINPEFYEAYANIGAALNKLKQYEKAKEILHKSIEKLPQSAGAYTNLGNVYNNLNEYEKAKQYHLHSIEMAPNNALAYANLALAQKNLLQLQSAVQNFKKAIKLNPRFVNAHFDLSTTLLMMQEFKEGFREYEWRFAKPQMKGFILQHKEIFAKPMLTKNTNAYKKTILLHSEQGFGDSLMMARFIPKLKETFGCKVVLQVRDELVTLFAQSFEDEVVARSEKTPEFDFHLPMMSLPFVLQVQSKEEFGVKSYLKVKDKPFTLPKDKKKIGICWSASTTGESYAKKVFDLAFLKPLIQSSKFDIYSLEVGQAKKDIEKLKLQEKIIDKSDQLTDFATTAALVKELDLVITCDTAIAHLCGGLGVKAWVVLQKVPDWRWGIKSSQSYLYESVKLFRQPSHGDFKTVFEDINTKLGV